MRHILLTSLIAMSVVVVPACLVDSRCIADSDCPGVEMCDISTGVCVLECRDDDACLGLRPHCLAEEYRCVACLDRDQCEQGETCVSYECVPDSTPSFSLVDENANSPTYGETVDLAELEESVVLLFFADLS